MHITSIKYNTMKNLIRILTVLILTFVCSVTNAQKPGSENSEEINEPKVPKVQEFNSQNIAGILKYNDAKVVKKIGISEDEKEAKVKALITNYNKEIDELALANEQYFKDVKDDVDKKVEFAMTNKDYPSLKKIYKGGQDKLVYIKNEIEEKEEFLNIEMSFLLSEKQNKKWLAYQQKMKERLNKNYIMEY